MVLINRSNVIEHWGDHTSDAFSLYTGNMLQTRLYTSKWGLNIMIDYIVTGFSLSPICVCPLKTNLTQPPPLFLSVWPSIHLPVLSCPASSDSSINQLFLSVFLSCLGCVDSSLVSCRRSVLLRHGHWSDTYTLSAKGQVTILSHFFPPQFFSSVQKFLHPPLGALFSPSSPSSSIVDHLVEGWQKVWNGRQK